MFDYHMHTTVSFDAKGTAEEMVEAAIKAGWKNDEKELLAVVKEVMSREDLKYCPHGRPICVTLSKKMLEKQFRRT